MKITPKAPNILESKEYIELETLSQLINELKAENVSLCGHTNEKQKIHLTMNLKKDMVELQNQLRAKQAECTQLMAERDAFRQESRKSKAALKENELSGTIAGIVKVKRGLAVQNAGSIKPVSTSPEEI